MIYQKIHELCRVKNLGHFYHNRSDEPTPRVQWILRQVEELGIETELDRWSHKDTTGWNLYMLGSSDKWFVAHHDIVNPDSENAQDNTASIINLIALKLLAPHVNIAILDGEEVGGLGAHRLVDKIEEQGWPVSWILNLELTGRGGTEFFIGKINSDSKLRELIMDRYQQCEEHRVPFNDSWILRSRGLDSVVINPLPRVDGKLDMRELYICHSSEDKADRVSIKEMQQFVEEILLPLT
jgi:hypothetical protein